jgi:hypothetical protein
MSQIETPTTRANTATNDWTTHGSFGLLGVERLGAFSAGVSLTGADAAACLFIPCQNRMVCISVHVTFRFLCKHNFIAYRFFGSQRHSDAGE